MKWRKTSSLEERREQGFPPLEHSLLRTAVILSSSHGNAQFALMWPLRPISKQKSHSNFTASMEKTQFNSRHSLLISW